MAVMEITRALRRRHEQCIQSLIRQTTLCDRTSTAGVRAWFKDIEMAGGEVSPENQIEIATRTTAGSLRWELELYITAVLATNDNVENRFNVSWRVVKAYLRTDFLHVNEQCPQRWGQENETKRLWARGQFQWMFPGSCWRRLPGGR